MLCEPQGKLASVAMRSLPTQCPSGRQAVDPIALTGAVRTRRLGDHTRIGCAAEAEDSARNTQTALRDSCGLSLVRLMSAGSGAVLLSKLANEDRTVLAY